MKKTLLLIAMLLASAGFAFSQDLNPGDIAIVGANFDGSPTSDPAENFAIVALVNIAAGTEIKFTDNGWLAAGEFRANEGSGTYTFSATSAGDVIIITPSVELTSTIGGLNFSGSGDQILAYQGDEATPTFIYAFNNEGGAGEWQADATSSKTSALPTGLTNGETAVAIVEIDNTTYTGSTSGTKEALLALIGDNANWTGDNTNAIDLTTIGPFTIDGGLPVELVAFDATVNGKDAMLNWETASEAGASHFEVQSFVGDRFTTVASVEAAGAGSYNQAVNNLTAGNHSFRLKMVDVDGSVAFSSVVEVAIDMPTAFELSAAYPNPFNPETRFAVTVAETQNVAVEIFNALGQKVATLHNGQLTAGTAYNFTFTAANLPSGLYLYRATGENFVATRTLSLVK